MAQIISNVFNSFDPLILSISGVDSLVFKHNKIGLSGTYPVMRKGAPVLNIHTIHHQIVENNQIEPGFSLFGD